MLTMPMINIILLVGVGMVGSRIRLDGISAISSLKFLNRNKGKMFFVKLNQNKSNLNVGKM